MNCYSTSPSAISAFRKVTEQPSPILNRKRCACGAVVTAKQLTQYGRCVSCIRGARG